MSELEQIELRVRGLSPSDFAAFREWFREYDEQVWDQQIAEDSKSGRLDSFLAEAKEEYGLGKTREL